MNKAWIYCRSAYPDETALAAQKDCLTAYAKGRGFEVVGVTAECASGLDFSRAGIQEVIDAAQHGAFSVLLVKDIARLGRSIKGVDSFAEQMDGLGIEVAFLDGTTLEDHYRNIRAPLFSR